MNANENNRNGNGSLNTTPVAESSEPAVSQGRIRAPESIDGAEKAEPVTRFATRTAVKGAEGISKGKLILLGGGLAVAVLFFVFTAIVGKSPKKLAAVKQPSQQAKQEQSPPSKGSVTPLMETVRTPAPDNNSGQLGPGDIRRTRTLDNSSVRSRSPASLLLPAPWEMCPLSQTRNRSGKIRHPMAELPLQTRRKRNRTA